MTSSQPSKKFAVLEQFLIGRTDCAAQLKILTQQAIVGGAPHKRPLNAAPGHAMRSACNTATNKLMPMQSAFTTTHKKLWLLAETTNAHEHQPTTPHGKAKASLVIQCAPLGNYCTAPAP